MTIRQTLIMTAVFLLGCAIVGAFFSRPAAAEPRADGSTTGRYQVIAIHGNSPAGNIVVIDTTTGECWNNSGNGQQNDWTAMGTPTKAK
jgi:hypothetical protein